MVYSINEIESIVIPIAKKYPLTRLNLFGSYSKGIATEESDIDLSIEYAEYFDYSELKEELSLSLDKEVDIVNINDIDPILSVGMKVWGIQIYVKD